jgi:catechol 2,3-dioxygenase-like lactoylglutathione lyase family enzyme
MTSSKGPPIFRILVGARDLEVSARFYERLLATRGRTVAAGRVYFDCGPVILGVLDRSSDSDARRARVTESIYFATGDLGAIHRRARTMGCLAKGLLHGDAASPLGEVVQRPWGERSFYAEDPAGNSLCFVDERTLFTGSATQIRALARRSDSGTRGNSRPRPRRTARRPTSSR